MISCLWKQDINNRNRTFGTTFSQFEKKDQISGITTSQKISKSRKRQDYKGDPISLYCFKCFNHS